MAAIFIQPQKFLWSYNGIALSPSMLLSLAVETWFWCSYFNICWLVWNRMWQKIYHLRKVCIDLGVMAQSSLEIWGQNGPKQVFLFKN